MDLEELPLRTYTRVRDLGIGLIGELTELHPQDLLNRPGSRVTPRDIRRLERALARHHLSFNYKKKPWEWTADITPGDWRKIFKFPWPARKRTLLRELHACGNRPLSKRKIVKLPLLRNFDAHGCDSWNPTFRDLRLPYAMHVERGAVRMYKRID